MRRHGGDERRVIVNVVDWCLLSLREMIAIGRESRSIVKILSGFAKRHARDAVIHLCRLLCRLLVIHSVALALHTLLRVRAENIVVSERSTPSGPFGHCSHLALPLSFVRINACCSRHNLGVFPGLLANLLLVLRYQFWEAVNILALDVSAVQSAANHRQTMMCHGKIAPEQQEKQEKRGDEERMAARREEKRNNRTGEKGGREY